MGVARLKRPRLLWEGVDGVVDTTVEERQETLDRIVRGKV